MIWKQIPSYPDYEASEEGQVRRMKPGKRQVDVSPLAQTVEKNGYIRVRLWVDGRGKNEWLQRLVCEAFHGPAPTPKHQAAHGDGIRTNCREDNLSWKTRKENYQDSIRHGTSKRGEGNFMAVLNADQVHEIRSRLRTERPAKIATSYGVTEAAIKQIKNGKTWRHLS